MGREQRRAEGSILYPERWNENDVTFNLVGKLLEVLGNKYSIRPAVQAYAKTEIGVRQPRRCFFDLVIFKIAEPPVAVAIVEVKKSSRRKVELTKQIAKYRSFGLPVFEVRGPEEINPKVESIKNHIQNFWERETERGE